MKPFVGRDVELERLEDLSKSGRACLVVIKGRRRIGKSRLAEEFGKKKIFLPFSGLAPVKGVSAQQQRDAFARQMAFLFNLPPFTFTDWSDAFAHLSRHLSAKPTVILFDEISWMGTKDPTFVSKLKVWWDLVLQNHPSVILILCGSISTWIDKNIINSTAFFGRVSLYLELAELTISESRELLNLQGFKGSDLDFFKILCVTGGIPWYLEQIQTFLSMDENIKRLCFEKNGLLVHEFDRIFNDLFSSRGEIYKKIITLLSQGMKDRITLQKAMGYSPSGTLSNHLKALEICGFISKHPDWSLKTGKSGKQTLYRLSDNYLRFYIHYIEPNLAKIEQGSFLYSSNLKNWEFSNAELRSLIRRQPIAKQALIEDKADAAKSKYEDSEFEKTNSSSCLSIEAPLSSLPGWEPMLGFQLENLLLKNRSILYKAIGIHAQDIVIDNPYFQRSAGRKKGCQIDYLIQMHSNTFFVCEVKMRRRELGLEVVDAMKEKIAALAIPKGFGVSPVLFHLGPVSDALLSSRYFYRIIDIADL